MEKNNVIEKWEPLHENDEFVNAQEMGKLYPHTFEVPTMEELNYIEVGDWVKVCRNMERFWAIITEINEEEITAKVDNILINEENDDLQLGSIINFRKENIYSLYPQ